MIDADKLQFVSLIWSRKHSCKKLRFVNIFDCLFDLVQTALMQRVEILKRVWFVKYMVFVAPNRKAVCQLSCYCIK